MPAKSGRWLGVPLRSSGGTSDRGLPAAAIAGNMGEHVPGRARAIGPAWIARVPAAAGIFVVALGVLVHIGWLTGLRSLTAVSPGLPATKALAASGFVLAGLGTALHGSRKRWSRQAGSLLTAVLVVGAVAVVGQWLLGIDKSSNPSPKTAVPMILFGLAQLTIDSDSKVFRRGHLVALSGFAFAVWSIGIGYLYGSSSLTSSTSQTGVSLLAELAMLALLPGIVLERPDREPARWLWHAGPAGTLVRRLAPCVLLAPPVLGFAALLGRDAGVFDVRFGTALLVASLMFVFLAVLLATARTVERGEQQRTEAAALHASALETSLNAYVAIDERGVVTAWNREAERIFGRSSANALGQQVSTLIVPERRRASHRRGLRRYLETGESRLLGKRMELSALRADGSEFPVELSISATEHAGRRMFHAFIADISARRAAEAERRLLATVVGSTMDAVITVDRRGLITSWNEGAERLYGYSAAEMIGRPLTAPPAPMASHASELLPKLLAGEHVTERGLARRRRDGSTIYVDLSGAPLVDEEGQLVGAATIARDVSERKRSERRLLAAEKRFRELLESAPDSIVIANDGGQIEIVNARAEEQFGYERTELIGQPLETLIPQAKGRGDGAGLLAAARVRPIRVGLELTAVRRDGSEFPAEISLSPLRTDEGVLVSAAIRDVSARRLIERDRERALLELEEAQKLAGLGSWWLDPATDAATWSAEMYRIFDRDIAAGPPTGEDLLRPVHPDDCERIAAAYCTMFGGGPGIELDYRLVSSDGAVRSVHALGREDPNQPGCYTGTVQDVTTLRAAEQSLREAEERFRRAFDDAPIGMALISLEGQVERSNAALGAICERSRSELEGVSVRELIHPADRDLSDEAMRALRQGDTEQLTVSARLVRSSGGPVEVDTHATLLRDASGRPTQVLCQVQDVTDRNRFEEQLKFMADHDPLTGLLNRRRFEEQLDHHVAHMKRYGTEGALIVLDIDNFKSVNDMLGHAAGDELIVSIAGVLRRRLRESDVLARLGGDEFAVLLPHAHAAEAASVAEAVVLAVRSHAAVLGGTRKSVTTSVGVAMFERSDPGDLSADTILIEADLAMYDAKEAGRDRHAFFESSPYRVSRTKARLTWAGRIERALETDRLTLMAQPILDLRTSQIHGHELLIRMLDERDEIIPPVTFLGVAERYGLIARIDEWVSRQAIELIAQRPSARLSVNISGRSLGDERLLEAIADRLRESRIDPGRLTFEVTETGAVTNLAQAQAFAHQLRDRGCRFALDDFGAGFGSFYYLKHLPFDYVKIDGEFVQHAVTGRIDQLVIEAVVGIAQGLGEETVAEFVTDEKIMRMARRLGVDYGQGRHIGEPRPVAEVFALPDRHARRADGSGTRSS